jgi:benzoyl-CoA reductase/2-hydroxyglutaryl-CoA dehydratase subunit BcrC/BadD/HgdB
MDLPGRRLSIERHRSAGERIAAVFPGRYPREVLHAAGFLPVEVWDPAGPIARASGHLQPFVCGVGMRGLELLLSERTPSLDCLVFPHLCDTLQNLFTVVRDCIGVPVPAFLFYTPRNVQDPGVRDFVVSRIRRLAGFLSGITGRSISDEDLLAAGRELDQGLDALRKLYEARSSGTLAIPNAEFYRTVRLREYVAPAEFVQAADRLLTDKSRPTAQPTGTTRLVLSGVLPDRDLLALLDQLGVSLREDDLISCGRRFSRAAPPGAANQRVQKAAGAGPRSAQAVDPDPWKASADRLLALPPCTSIASPVETRVKWLADLVSTSGSRGVLFHTVKFCELELFDHPFVVDGLRKAGIPVLVLESELHQPQPGQLATRLEAFLEVLS